MNCATPKNFQGNSALVTGVLKLKPLPNGASEGKGLLKISLLNPLKVWVGTRKVLGVYDDLTEAGSERYFHGGARVKNGDDILAIYINFSRPDASYVEYGDLKYLTACTEKK